MPAVRLEKKHRGRSRRRIAPKLSQGFASIFADTMTGALGQILIRKTGVFHSVSPTLR